MRTRTPRATLSARRRSGSKSRSEAGWRSGARCARRTSCSTRSCSAYYGTVDATLLFLILLAQYVDWSGDVTLARELLPNARAAIQWSVAVADHDGDGFLDYTGQYENGLVNQGWKDSGNGIMNADG